MAKFAQSICYQLKITLTSPLSVGSGESVYTDHDVILDGRGMPMIPATAIAGVCGSFLGEQKETLLGRIERKEKQDGKTDTLPPLETKLRFYDGICTSQRDDIYVMVRDSVKLKRKVAVDGAKFDMQIVEPGTQFTAYIELLDPKYAEVTENFLKAVNRGEVRFGTKTTRGYGKVKLSVYKKCLNDVETWLDFRMFENKSWDGCEKMSLEGGTSRQFKLRVKLSCIGGMSIREYSTNVGEPDYRMLTLKSSNKPAIPGTSWAGAFRERFASVLGEEEARALFGFVDEGEGVARKSRIVFAESTIDGGVSKETTRNSLDRFSGATKTGALFTEKTHYYGDTVLEITMDKKVSEQALKALAICLADLHNGFLAVGGLTSVGRGLFNITDINGSETLTACITGDAPDIDGFVKEVLGDAE